MEETIHINVELHKSDTHYISITKTRLWSQILISLNWLIKAPIARTVSIQNGLGLMIINNLAILIEGFISDLITEHLDNNELVKPKEIKGLDKNGWSHKKELYNKTFQKDLESYAEYKSIESLFFLRNNISHGKTHNEINKTHIISGQKTIIESVDKNYQKVRKYLVEKKVITEKDTSSNVDVLWKLQIAFFFFSESKKFLFAVIQTNESNKKQAILSELQSSLSVPAESPEGDSAQ